MKKQHSLPLKSFIKELKALVKPDYLKAMWPVGGIAIIFIAITCILSFLATSVMSSMMMSVMMIMYGMASPAALLMGLLEILGAAAISIALSFFFNFFMVAIQYTYQDRLAHPEQPVSAGSIWMHYKHLRKNQVWRIALYIGLFIFLWSLPLDIIGGLVGGLTKNTVWPLIIRIVNDIVILWKALEYSQSYFLYREKQPQFLGQSMRHALTASRRFMNSRKWNYLLINVVCAVLPVLVWTLIFGGLAFYGNYTATYVLTYVGLALVIIGIACYLPVILAAGTLYYVKSKDEPDPVDIDVVFKDTFKPVAELTGEAYVHEVYTPAKPKKQPSPVAKKDDEPKREAKKDE